jgi:hypothetical protein
MNNWDSLADTLGYRDEEHMLSDMYLNQGFSLSLIADKLGNGKATIRRRLSLYNIERRSRGGANNPSLRRLYLHLLDQRWVYSASKKEVAQVIEAHPSTVWKYMKGES